MVVQDTAPNTFQMWTGALVSLFFSAAPEGLVNLVRPMVGLVVGGGSTERIG